MDNVSNLYPMITQCATDILKIIITAIFSAIIIPWVKKSAIPWLKEKQLYGVIKKFVRAAEKLGDNGTIAKEAKLEYVTALLAKRGVKVGPEVRAMIESAVGDLDDELAHNMQQLVNAINEAGGEAAVVYNEQDSAAQEDEEPPEVPKDTIKE